LPPSSSCCYICCCCSHHHARCLACLLAWLVSFLPAVRALLTFLCEPAKLLLLQRKLALWLRRLLLLRFRSLRSLARSLSLSCAPDEEGSAAKAAEGLRCEVAALRGRRLRWPGDRPTGADPRFRCRSGVNGEKGSG
jgi:hypothetical protein